MGSPTADSAKPTVAVPITVGVDHPRPPGVWGPLRSDPVVLVPPDGTNQSLRATVLRSRRDRVYANGAGAT